MPKYISTLLVAAIAVQWGANSSAQDIIETQKALADAEMKLNRIRMMLPACEKNSKDFANLNASLASAAEEVGRVKKRITDIEDGLLQRVKTQFENLTPCDKISWKIAPCQKTFLPALPGDVSITKELGPTRIKKTGNPPNLPIGPSPCYHVCPSFELAAGDRALLRVSIPSTPSRGGLPIPYFGLRDAAGKQVVLAFLDSINGDGKEHEIRVYCTGNDGFAFLDGSLHTQHAGKTNELHAPLYMFFHLNDTSQLIIHELRLNRVVTAPDRE